MALLRRHLGEAGPLNRQQILERFVPATAVGSAGRDTCNEALDALCTLGLARAESVPDAPVTYNAEDSGTEEFPTSLLRALRGLVGRQAVFMNLYEHCVRSEMRSVTADLLLDLARAHVDTSAPWTPEKIRFWLSLCAYTGIVLPQAQGAAIAPRPKKLLPWLRALANSSLDWVWIKPLFFEIDRSLAPCLTNSGSLHRGWAEALQVLRVQGRVILDSGSDAPEQLHVPGEGGGVYLTRIRFQRPERAVS
jgi:hypothetical protein